MFFSRVREGLSINVDLGDGRSVQVVLQRDHSRKRGLRLGVGAPESFPITATQAEPEAKVYRVPKPPIELVRPVAAPLPVETPSPLGSRRLGPPIQRRVLPVVAES